MFSFLSSFWVLAVLPSIWPVPPSYVSPPLSLLVVISGVVCAVQTTGLVHEWCVNAAGPLLRLHQQTSQIIIASPRSRCGAVTLNHGQRDEKRDREGVLEGGGSEFVFVQVSVSVFLSMCVQWLLMAVLAAFEHHSMSQTDSQVCHFNISPWDIRPNQKPEYWCVTKV